MALTPAERQRRRRARLPRRIDYYPSPEALKVIEAMQIKAYRNAGGYRTPETILSAVINRLMLGK